MTDNTDTRHDWTDSEKDAYLVFTLHDGLYATPLLDVREVVEFKSPKALPNTKPAFLGVINIRGEIIGVIDLSVRLGGPAVQGTRLSLLVISSNDGAISALVDEVQSVVQIEPSKIEKYSKGQHEGDSGYGVARLDDRLVTIIDLKKVIDSSDIANLKKLAA